ncbi:SGNH/GDSL hydrolase family protein [Bacillus paranthracis]|uniref:SGNH/GDSL hydrolase family protein n=4 Tax=Bacillus cereus group TaxID=86661 RepID=A0A5M9H6C4_9BACI|nr:SGNH/GDSL hydrolase family protein [Bacillus sp. FDAARGOS_527]EEL00493.1 Lipase/acylhydrolase with GDSL-like motif [Bacillus cereus BDRD-ST26]KAA8480847.1 SGNH/GDSL hydrolase family protein [Bacillus paranthracis]KAB7634472.1 SGNH/GDSL hydrolase family protein [Bacillus sp. B4-WWTP-NA-D-NA-NA]KAB7638100.1 SGNH/GDSL hydrolase family protein [Bacillus sp. B3-WWTP-C-10-D-3]MDR4404985.1 SGNH/GDSL hydrolase family protein [Bacillus anthracis]MRA59037.1 SGNH/GDSL hydrolase family protein [Bacill
MVHNKGGIHMWKRFVAIGDSFTEGIGDEVEGIALKSWVDHFVQLCVNDIEYANFAKRGLVTKEIRSQQLEKALTFNPDLVSLIAGANDVLKGRWNHYAYKEDMKCMIDTLSKTGADIMIANLPDFTVRLPFSTEKKQVLKEQLLEANEVILSLSREHQLHHIDFWNHQLVNDNTLWSKDFIHPNSKGYVKVAELIFSSLPVHDASK